MKKSILGAVLLFTSVQSLAVEKCYVALNPQNIKITKTSNDGESASVIESAKSAQVKLENQTKEVEFGGSKFNQPPTINFKAQSKTMSFKTSATQIETGSESFGVDCDGGQVTVKVVGGILVLNTTYLAGDIKTASEGCASGKVAFKDLALIEQKSCK
jgi:hypothetical protein